MSTRLRADIEVYGYSHVPHPDATTECLRSMVDTTGVIAPTLSDERVAEQVRADGIDILVDLSGWPVSWQAIGLI
jgi:predicted O-linked N-acetylglucosamine transferase (SPINDLY family)